MQKIVAGDYSKVSAIFRDLGAFQPMCAAVLEGVWPGQVWVDDAVKPRSGLLITFLSGGGAAWCFLGGDPDNQEFNTALSQAIFVDKAAGEEVGTFLFTCSPEDWGGQLWVVGEPRQPAPMVRQHYVCRELAYDWRSHLPNGYAIQPMAPILRKKPGLNIPELVKTTLDAWDSIKNEGFQDFGFVVIHKNQVVAWATVDFVTEKSGDLGFETLPKFRKRGLGSAVAAAALERGCAKGLEVHWTCAEDNVGSQRSARKLGLQRGEDYVIYLFALDVDTHLAQVAYSKLSSGEHEEAIDLYEQLFAQKTDVPTWAYFDTAQACAALGDADKALKYLRLAAKQGWPDFELTTQTAEFKILHKNPEWAAIIEKIRQNQSS